MREIGRNPGTLIPAWRDFVDRHAAEGRGVRGVGEPMWRERTPAAKAECHHHEALLNLAFRDDPGLFLLCPYDTQALEPATVERALARHPIAHRRPRRSGARYAADGGVDATLAEPLPPPGPDARTVAFAAGDLADVRAFVRRGASAAGMAADRTDDLVLATHEAAANSVRHGGGQGMLRMWLQDGHVVCEVADRGCITDPLVGRRHPAPGPSHSRGMWLMHHVCDLVQVRSTEGGHRRAPPRRRAGLKRAKASEPAAQCRTRRFERAARSLRASRRVQPPCGPGPAARARTGRSVSPPRTWRRGRRRPAPPCRPRCPDARRSPSPSTWST